MPDQKNDDPVRKLNTTKAWNNILICIEGISVSKLFKIITIAQSLNLMFLGELKEWCATTTGMTKINFSMTWGRFLEIGSTQIIEQHMCYMHYLQDKKQVLRSYETVTVFFLKRNIHWSRLTVVACTSGNLVIQMQHGFSFKKIGWCNIGPRN